ncbi:MAG: Ig-like domain-containing protein [Clostridia bacterium]|nr:Ig-like domain-containing protein [Clostridia bacterium]
MKKIYRILVAMLAFIMAISFSAFILGCSCSDKNSSDENVVILNQSQINLLIGDKTTVKVTNAYKFDAITWSSDNENVAKVDQNGVIEGYSVGTTKIKATAADNTAECTVTVSLGNTLPQIMLENERSVYNIGKSTTTLPFNTFVRFNEKTFYDATVEYSSSNTEVIQVASDNRSFTVVGSGQAEISISATWRGLDFDDVPSLYKTVTVNVVDELYFYINNRQYYNIELYTVNSFEGKTYDSQMPFSVTAEYNGVMSSEVTVKLPEILKTEGGNIVADSYGEGKILMTFVADGKTFDYAINVTVSRPRETYKKQIKYFSSHIGTFKDEESDFEDKSLIKEIFGTTDVSGLKAYQSNKELTIEDGKIFDLTLAENDKYNSVIRLETDKVIYDVNLTVYSLVIQSAKDLENFSLKILNSDNALTPGYDETEVTAIDGYCELISNIDAEGVKIEHPALNASYNFVNAAGATVSVNVAPNRYNVEGGLRKFGFLGVFNGNGHTISNLDCSVEDGQKGGGLFGYILGGATVKDVAFTNINITNSSGITYGAHVPIPLVGGTDSLGLKLAHTLFKDIYVEISDNTVNPQGAIMKTVYNTWNGVYDFINVIVDATGVTIDGSTAGGILTSDGTMLYKAAYKNRKNVFVISDNYPISKNASFTVYGENEANGAKLDELVDGKAYSTGVKRYNSYADMAADENSYSDFSSSWSISDYPIFKSSFEVLPEYDGEYIYDSKIIVNSASTAKPLILIEVSSGKTINAQFTDYDDEKIIVENGSIKLAKEVSAEETTSLTLNYEHKGKAKSMVLTVRMLPSNILIEDQIVMSAYDGKLSIDNYFEKGEKIKSVSQVVGTDEIALTVTEDGLVKGVLVKIKPDYSDVDNIALKVTTNVTTYNFTAIKAYSHIISKPSDLKVFERLEGAGRTTGYYILANNIKMEGATLNHVEIKMADIGDTTNVFQGVFDGQGYSIIGFKPGIGGLFNSIYSDTEENGGKSIIRNVGFVGVQSEAEKDFTILGEYVNSAKEGVQVEITNVHVEIENTYLSKFNPTSNYRGIFKSNSAEKSNIFNNFKMTNVYVEILNEEYTEIVSGSYGTVLSRDHLIVNSTITSRSARFSNVVSISKANPLVYRQFDEDDKLATEWGIYMYFVYSENDVGKNGLTYRENHDDTLDELIKPHNPIADNKEIIGCYVYNNVYRYDTATDVTNAKKDGFIATGLWEISKGVLKWKTAPYKADASSEDNNFNPGWLGAN